MFALRRRIAGVKYLDISPTTVSFDYTGSESKTINVTSNATWDVRS